MSEENTGEYWPGFGGTDPPGEGNAGATTGPHWSYIGASCGPSCGTGEHRDIYGAAVANEDWFAQVARQREAEDTAYEDWLEYRQAQQEKETEASDHDTRHTSQKGA